MAKLDILLVEPEQHWALLIKTLLGDRYKLTIIDNVESALHRMDEIDFQLVLLSFQLPNHNGVELLNEKASDSRLFAIPCIVYSDITEIDTVDEHVWQAYGVHQYIKKNDLATHLLPTLERLL